MDDDSDFISNLPEEVTDQILIRLPIRDAVRTCFLSTKWRYKWTTINQLGFHDLNKQMQLASSLNERININDKIINFINQVLLLHNECSIHKFELSTICLFLTSSIIDAWIPFLSRKNIQELFLNLGYAGDDGEHYILPSCFFSAQQISTLHLCCCLVKKPPPTFIGFGNLKSLRLHRITFVEKGGFECFISKCPILERLTLNVTYHGIDHLNISSPNLKYLCLEGCYQDFCYEYTPLLSDVTIETTYLSIENMVKVLSSVPNLRKFAVEIVSLKFLSLSKILEKLPFTCNHLNNLSVGLYFGAVNAICITLCLLNSSPNLRELEIESYSFCNPGRKDIENFWEKRALIHWNMSRLQIVKIIDFKGSELELEFIKLLLANSPMLEMLTIISDYFDIYDSEGLEFSQELLIFPRASPKAKIKFLNS